MRIAICDDKYIDAEYIKDLCISADALHIHSFSIFTNGVDLLETYTNTKLHFDLIFLDVDMPGMSGIQVGKAIREIDHDIVIVFITNYSQYALDAYECEPFNYIIKPPTKMKITRILTRTQEKLRTITHYHVIKQKGKTLRLPVCDIYYVECAKKHVLYYTDTMVYDTVGNISDAYKALANFGFIQIHQGYIVNMDKIIDFDSRHVLLDNGSKVEISFRKKAQTLKAYAEFLERYI